MVQRAGSSELAGGWQEDEARRFFHAFQAHGKNWEQVLPLCCWSSLSCCLRTLLCDLTLRNGVTRACGQLSAAKACSRDLVKLDPAYLRCWRCGTVRLCAVAASSAKPVSQVAAAVETQSPAACEALFSKHATFLNLPPKFQFEVTFMAMLQDQRAEKVRCEPTVLECLGLKA